MTLRRIFSAALFSFIGIANAAIATQPLKLLYEIRDPISYRDSRGRITGLVITPTAQAMQHAGISYVWVETPFKRQLSVVEANDEAVCAVGMFKNKDRQRYAKFSQAIFHDTDRPSVMLTHRDFQPEKSMDLLRTLSIPGIKMLKKDAASYGSVIDDAIERSRVMVVNTTAESLNMAKMLVARRADFIFVPEDEALNMIKTIPGGEQLHIFKPLGMPQGPERFLMCSLQVPDELIQRFNKALIK